jgi:hypothetical protein
MYLKMKRKYKKNYYRKRKNNVQNKKRFPNQILQMKILSLYLMINILI